MAEETADPAPPAVEDIIAIDEDAIAIEDEEAAADADEADADAEEETDAAVTVAELARLEPPPMRDPIALPMAEVASLTPACARARGPSVRSRRDLNCILVVGMWLKR